MQGRLGSCCVDSVRSESTCEHALVSKYGYGSRVALCALFPRNAGAREQSELVLLGCKQLATSQAFATAAVQRRQYSTVQRITLTALLLLLTCAVSCMILQAW